MQRSLPLLTAALVTTAVVGPFHPAAAAPSCHGQQPTIVGQPGHEINGTQHRDVILTQGAKKVRSLGGDDLVCVDAHSVVVTLVYSGEGNDTVFVTDPTANVRYYGASGSDTYKSVGPTDNVSLLGDGRDFVSTGVGGDFVGVRTAGGHDGSPTVELGPGNDHLILIGAGSRGHFDGGPRDDDLTIIHKSTEVWDLDNERGEAKAGMEVRLRWRGIERFDMGRLLVPEIDFRGSALSEQFTIESRQKRRLALHMGGGDDYMSGGAADDLLDGGPGHDFAFGEGGTDTCWVEEQVDCELLG